jgi:hypothetical protein
MEEQVHMAEFTVIKESEAPRPARQTGRLAARMREYEKYIEAVPNGKVGRLTPSRGETARGIALRISRAAKRMGKTSNTWVVDGVVYFSLS